MRCRRCGHRYAANRQVQCAPGGQESPGTFLILGSVFAVVGVLLAFYGYLGDHLYALGLGAIAAFLALLVWSQVLIAWIDCRRVRCTECGEPGKVRPWSL